MNPEELQELSEKETARQAKFEKRVLCCAAAGCVTSGGNATREAFKRAIAQKGLAAEVVGTGCLGLCGKGPLVKIAPDETLYAAVDASAAERIVDEHLARGRPLESNRVDTKAPFFTAQKKVVLENCGRIDSLSSSPRRRTTWR